ncbi:hypothetical protein ONE63_008148 [Megalurothrips usitatus]|uniref:Uncharacterized protein n=1 Tax=Megalurothrips usitatus TaxID=439358 RepID=A0AAV7XST1_9NEOP|nr:hypothetical protein ONE63_008148 [Megalurothrips usitatus]
MVSFAACDIHMLRDMDGEYVIKEFSLYSPLWDITMCSEVFAPPYDVTLVPQPYRRQNQYVTNFVHGQQWQYGDKPYPEYSDIIRHWTSLYSRIYVKGLEKKRLLGSIVTPEVDVINVEILGCPKLSKLSRLFVPWHCKQHATKPIHTCVVENAIRIGLWYVMNICI